MFLKYLRPMAKTKRPAMERHQGEIRELYRIITDCNTLFELKSETFFFYPTVYWFVFINLLFVFGKVVQNWLGSV